MANLPIFRTFIPFARKINYGVHGEIYALSRKYVAKIYRDPSRLKREHGVSRILQREGISVPRPEGLYTVRLDPFRLRQGFVMEYIHGIIGEDIVCKKKYEEIRSKVERLVREEVRKCEDLGFVCNDATRIDNSIYKPKEDKIVLVDFCNWKTPD